MWGSERIAVLLGALLAALVAVILAVSVFGSVGDDVSARSASRPWTTGTTPVPATGPAAGPATSAATSVSRTAAPFPVRSVPGTAFELARTDPTLSSRTDTLGLGAQPALATGADQGPPGWVKPGIRLTFHAAAASVAQSSFAWVEDPDGPWQDPVTGKHYRRTDETGESVGSASGDGFSQIDVVATEGTDVVLSLNLYAIDRETQTLVSSGATGAKVSGAEVDGAWINPARLAQLATVRADGLLVLRGDYPLNGTTYKAVSFAVTTPGAYQQYTYDTASGVLLSATSSTAGASSVVQAPGEGPAQGNQELTVTVFAGVRQRTVPGVSGASPGWVGRTARLDYGGTYQWVNPVDPSTGSLTSPMSMAVSLHPGGQTWASYTEQTQISALGSTSNGGSVTGPAGPYWLSQPTLAALAAMPVGRVFDQDPITGEQDTVASVCRDPSTGRDLLTVATRLPGLTTLAGYDRTTGVLATYRVQIPASGSTMSLQLQGGP